MNGLVLEMRQHLADQRLMDILRLISSEQIQQPLDLGRRVVLRDHKSALLNVANEVTVLPRFELSFAQKQELYKPQE
jgi:hypothetical protein